MDELAAVISAYFPQTRTVTARELAGGNINRGFLLEDGERRLVVQRLNPAVFPDPRQVVKNFAVLSSHLGSKNFLVARPVATLAGADCFQAADGSLWRAQSYIEEHALDATAQPESMGKILARFHRLTAGLPPEHLPQTVPGFHDTPRYLAAADRALAETPISAQDEADLRWCRHRIERLRPMANYFAKEAAAGKISRQVTHGDPKRENFICDKSGRALGLFDLDTAGPGLVAHDLGDCLRSLANLAGEEADMAAIHFDVDICQAFLCGYRGEYTEAGEKAPELYAFAGILTIAFELALRRLSDHLCGDRYFCVRRHGDNLRLAMAQFRLAELVAASEQKIRCLAE